jgi:hypothetical protein
MMMQHDQGCTPYSIYAPLVTCSLVRTCVLVLRVVSCLVCSCSVVSISLSAYFVYI